MIMLCKFAKRTLTDLRTYGSVCLRIGPTAMSMSMFDIVNLARIGYLSF